MQVPRQQPPADELCWTVNKKPVKWWSSRNFYFLLFSLPLLSSSSTTFIKSFHHILPPPLSLSLWPSVFLSNRGGTGGWKPSRDFSAALLDAALNNPRSSPAKRQRFYITSKHLYGDRSGFIALSAFHLHQPAPPSKRKTLAQSSTEAFFF